MHLKCSWQAYKEIERPQVRPRRFPHLPFQWLPFVYADIVFDQHVACCLNKGALFLAHLVLAAPPLSMTPLIVAQSEEGIRYLWFTVNSGSLANHIPGHPETDRLWRDFLQNEAGPWLEDFYRCAILTRDSAKVEYCTAQCSTKGQEGIFLLKRSLPLSLGLCTLTFSALFNLVHATSVDITPLPSELSFPSFLDEAVLPQLLLPQLP